MASGCSKALITPDWELMGQKTRPENGILLCSRNSIFSDNRKGLDVLGGRREETVTEATAFIPRAHVCTPT